MYVGYTYVRLTCVNKFIRSDPISNWLHSAKLVNVYHDRPYSFNYN